MRYINQKTGAVVDSPFVISGGDWIANEDVKEEEIKEVLSEPILDIDDEKEVEEEVIEEEVVEETVEDDDGIDGVTVKQIKQELDAFGIAYDPRAKKKELYDLMMQGK